MDLTIMSQTNVERRQLSTRTMVYLS